MATFGAIFVPATSDGIKISALAASTAQEVALGPNVLFAIQGTGDLHVDFYRGAGTDTASASSWLVQGGSIQTFDLGQQFDHISVYNPNASAIDVYILQLSRT